MKSAWKDEATGLLVYTGQEARDWLVCRYGIPNAFPTDKAINEFGVGAYIRASRVMFVDDENNGEPVALWQP